MSINLRTLSHTVNQPVPFVCLVPIPMHICVYEGSMINQRGRRQKNRKNETWLPFKDIGHIDLILMYMLY